MDLLFLLCQRVCRLLFGQQLGQRNYAQFNIQSTCKNCNYYQMHIKCRLNHAELVNSLDSRSLAQVASTALIGCVVLHKNIIVNGEILSKSNRMRAIQKQTKIIEILFNFDVFSCVCFCNCNCCYEIAINENTIQNFFKIKIKKKTLALS